MNRIKMTIISLLFFTILVCPFAKIDAGEITCGGCDRSPRCEEVYYYDPIYTNVEERTDFRLEAYNVVDARVERDVETTKSLKVSLSAGADVGLPVILSNMKLQFLMQYEGTVKHTIKAIWPTKAGVRYLLKAGMRVGTESGKFVHINQYCEQKETFVDVKGETSEFIHSEII